MQHSLTILLLMTYKLQDVQN